MLGRKLLRLSTSKDDRSLVHRRLHAVKHELSRVLLSREGGGQDGKTGA